MKPCCAIAILCAFASHALADGRRYEVKRIGKNRYEVQRLPDLEMDDPDRFAMRLVEWRQDEKPSEYETDPAKACPPRPPKKCAAPRPARPPSCEEQEHRLGQARQESINWQDAVTGLSTPRTGGKGLDSVRAGLAEARRKEAAEWAAVQACRAAADKTQAAAVEADAAAFLRCQEEAKAAADEQLRKCQEELADRIAERKRLAPTRPLDELRAIPAESRLPEEIARLAAPSRKKGARRK